MFGVVVCSLIVVVEFVYILFNSGFIDWVMIWLLNWLVIKLVIVGLLFIC